MSQRTVLYAEHESLGAKLVDFAGWHMPMNYGSQIEEHHAVRQDAGIFDVSHMQAVDVVGADATAFLRRVLANDVARMSVGRAQYSCMLNEHGGIIDDLITYFLSEGHYRIVVNAGTAQKDITWLQMQARKYDVRVVRREGVAILAVQGPRARARVVSAVGALHVEAISQLKPFSVAEVEGWTIARTGYTGEDGLELILPEEEAVVTWRALLDAGCRPCGLGARDTLRLEAGLNLYGTDMDEHVTPLNSGLAWTVDFRDKERHFIGREALERDKGAGISERFVGLILPSRGILRSGQKVMTAQGEGLITSGSFSPVLKCSIALARIPEGEDTTAQVEIRKQTHSVNIISPPFVRNGEIKINMEEIES